MLLKEYILFFFYKFLLSFVNSAVFIHLNVHAGIIVFKCFNALLDVSTMY